MGEWIALYESTARIPADNRAEVARVWQEADREVQAALTGLPDDWAGFTEQQIARQSIT